MTGPGTTIAGRYEVIRQLGAGAMGAVWLAHDTALGREVAVKSVRGPLIEDQTGSAEGEQRAMREARMIARVNHPNAVAIYDVAMHEGRPWLVMEYVPSQNLAEVVEQHGPFSPHRAAELGAQVAAALAEVHRAGIVHRDVKPANVLMSEQGEAKITDFGIARGDGDVTLTATGTMWGTPAYFAPEVAGGDTPTDKADVWSLGASLYFAVEGRPPHGTDTSPLVLLGRIANQPVPRPEQAGPLTPVLARLLDRDPGGRPTMTEAAHLLRDVAAGRAVSDATAPLPMAAAGAGALPDDTETDQQGPPDDEQTPMAGLAAGSRTPHGADERTRRSRLLPVVLALVVLVAVAGVTWLAFALGGEESPNEASSDPSPPATTPSSLPTSESAPQTSPPPSDSTPEPSPETSPEPTDGPQGGNGNGNGNGGNGNGNDDGDADEQPAELFTPSTMESTVADYYAILPDDTEAGFELLGPQLRSQGFDRYESFWDDIESVSVSDLQADPGSRSVSATVVFEPEDGETSTESHEFGLIPNDEGDGLLINTDSAFG